MTTSSVVFKCYYGNEIRRLSLASVRATEYAALVEQLQGAFGIAPTQQLRLRWLDEEGDKVALTSDGELADAVRCPRDSGQAVKVFVTAAEPAEAHEGVTCDGCGCGVSGQRFKCLLCPNYDLCAPCVSGNAHAQHPMLLIRRSGEFPGQLFSGCRRRWGWGGCGPRFWGAFASAAESAAAEAAAAEAAAAAADAERPAGPPPPPSTDAAAAAAAAAAAPAEDSPMPTGSATSNGCHGNSESDDPKLARALEHMRAMGFSDDGGWLTRLLVAKDGDICAVLDAIRPAASK